MDNQDHTLYSGAAKGAEACFGENSERWKLNEVNYSFDGHKDSRTCGSTSAAVFVSVERVVHFVELLTL